MAMAILAGYSKKFAMRARTVQHDLEILERMKTIMEKIDMTSIRPSNNARRTLDVCFRNKMARRLAGKPFRDKLFGTYEIEMDGKINEVVIDESDWKHFKEIVI